MQNKRGKRKARAKRKRPLAEGAEVRIAEAAYRRIQARTPQPPVRPAPVWLGLLSLVAGLLLLGLAGSWAAEVPQALAEARRYVAAVPCSDAARVSCLSTESFVVDSLHSSSRNSKGSWVTVVEPSAPLPLPPGAEHTINLGSEQLGSGIHEKDQARLTSWEGHSVSLEVAGKVWQADPPPARRLFGDLQGITALLPLGLVGCWAGIRILSRTMTRVRLRPANVVLAVCVPILAELALGAGQQFDSLDLALYGHLAVLAVGALLWSFVEYRRRWGAYVRQSGSDQL